MQQLKISVNSVTGHNPFRHLAIRYFHSGNACLRITVKPWHYLPALPRVTSLHRQPTRHALALARRIAFESGRLLLRLGLSSGFDASPRSLARGEDAETTKGGTENDHNNFTSQIKTLYSTETNREEAYAKTGNERAAEALSGRH
jgi:hypothetical protein